MGCERWISFNVILPRNSDSDNDEFIAITFATAQRAMQDGFMMYLISVLIESLALKMSPVELTCDDQGQGLINNTELHYP